MAKNNSTSKSKVFIEVLQNGEFLAETSRPYKKRGLVKISSGLSGDLSLPFYPLAQDIKLIQITRKGVKLFLDSTWEGFITCDGQPINIVYGRHDTRSYIMREGDYGSICYKDLRVLIRIGPDQNKPKSIPLDPKYKGKMKHLIFDNRTNFPVMAIAALCSLIMLGAPILGLIKRPDLRPKKLIDLDETYTLAFIHPSHLKLLPEALQTNLDRDKPVASAIKYYENLTSLFLGDNPTEDKYIFPTSRELYKNMYAENKQKIATTVKTQRDVQATILDNNYKSMIAIPTIVGESIGGSILRLKDKLNIIHENFENSLQLRRRVTQSFKKDSYYDFHEYKHLTREDGTVHEGRIRKVNVFRRTSPEEVMYKEAESLSLKANYYQSRISHQKSETIPITVDNIAPIGLLKELNYISFLELDNYANLNHKIGFINASQFGAVKKDKIKEPLVGQINSKLIDKVISKNEFELQLCYELALRRNQLLTGKMEWQWRLDSRGIISDLTLLDTEIKDRRMARCVRKKIASWKFPRPKRGSVEVKYPFYFGPQKG